MTEIAEDTASVDSQYKSSMSSREYEMRQAELRDEAEQLIGIQGSAEFFGNLLERYEGLKISPDDADRSHFDDDELFPQIALKLAEVVATCKRIAAGKLGTTDSKAPYLL